MTRLEIETTVENKIWVQVSGKAIPWHPRRPWLQVIAFQKKENTKSSFSSSGIIIIYILVTLLTKINASVCTSYVCLYMSV